MNFAQPGLSLLVEHLDVIEEARKATASRYRIMTKTDPDADGEVRGFGLSEDSPYALNLRESLEVLENEEAAIIKGIQVGMQEHPLYPWLQKATGVGEKQLARFLGAIGWDPYWNTLYERPRTPGELRQCCGHGDPERSLPIKRKQGHPKECECCGRVHYLPKAKMRLWNISDSVVKSGIRKLPDADTKFTADSRKAITPYGAVYYNRRVATQEKTHSVVCLRCGPSGKPALRGSEWSDAHKHADALRIVGKEILDELWEEARRLH